MLLLGLQLVKVFKVIVAVVIEVNIGVNVITLVMRALHESLVLKVILVLRDLLLLDNINFFLEFCHTCFECSRLTFSNLLIIQITSV